MYTECDISTCPCQEQCLNQRFHKHEWVSGLEVIVTKDRGYGIRTSDSISNGKNPTSTLKSLISQKENSIMLNKQNRESYWSCSEMSLNKYSHFAQGRYCYSKTDLFSSWKRILSHSNKPFHGEYLLQRTCQWKHFVRAKLWNLVIADQFIDC